MLLVAIKRRGFLEGALMHVRTYVVVRTIGLLMAIERRGLLEGARGTPRTHCTVRTIGPRLLGSCCLVRCMGGLPLDD